jgi:hypothetical protein
LFYRFGDFVLPNLAEKQRRAVNVIRTALDSRGWYDRDVSACCASRALLSDCAENFAVFVSAPPGADAEPYYETGRTITEAVRKILAAVKGYPSDDGSKTTDDKPEAAPF